MLAPHPPARTPHPPARARPPPSLPPPPPAAPPARAAGSPQDDEDLLHSLLDGYDELEKGAESAPLRNSLLAGLHSLFVESPQLGGPRHSELLARLTRAAAQGLSSELRGALQLVAMQALRSCFPRRVALTSGPEQPPPAAASGPAALAPPVGIAAPAASAVVFISPPDPTAPLRATGGDAFGSGRASPPAGAQSAAHPRVGVAEAAPGLGQALPATTSHTAAPPLNGTAAFSSAAYDFDSDGLSHAGAALGFEGAASSSLSAGHTNPPPTGRGALETGLASPPAAARPAFHPSAGAGAAEAAPGPGQAPPAAVAPSSASAPAGNTAAAPLAADDYGDLGHAGTGAAFGLVGAASSSLAVGLADHPPAGRGALETGLAPLPPTATAQPAASAPLGRAAAPPPAGVVSDEPLRDAAPAPGAVACPPPVGLSGLLRPGQGASRAWAPAGTSAPPPSTASGSTAAALAQNLSAPELGPPHDAQQEHGDSATAPASLPRGSSAATALVGWSQSQPDSQASSDHWGASGDSPPRSSSASGDAPPTVEGSPPPPPAAAAAAQRQETRPEVRLIKAALRSEPPAPAPPSTRAPFQSAADEALQCLLRDNRDLAGRDTQWFALALPQGTAASVSGLHSETSITAKAAQDAVHEGLTALNAVAPSWYGAIRPGDALPGNWRSIQPAAPAGTHLWLLGMAEAACSTGPTSLSTFLSRAPRDTRAAAAAAFAGGWSRSMQGFLEAEHEAKKIKKKADLASLLDRLRDATTLLSNGATLHYVRRSGPSAPASPSARRATGATSSPTGGGSSPAPAPWPAAAATPAPPNAGTTKGAAPLPTTGGGPPGVAPPPAAAATPAQPSRTGPPPSGVSFTMPPYGTIHALVYNPELVPEGDCVPAALAAAHRALYFAPPPATAEELQSGIVNVRNTFASLALRTAPPAECTNEAERALLLDALNTAARPRQRVDLYRAVYPLLSHWGVSPIIVWQQPGAPPGTLVAVQPLPPSRHSHAFLAHGDGLYALHSLHTATLPPAGTPGSAPPAAEPLLGADGHGRAQASEASFPALAVPPLTGNAAAYAGRKRDRSAGPDADQDARPTSGRGGAAMAPPRLDAAASTPATASNGTARGNQAPPPPAPAAPSPAGTAPARAPTIAGRMTMRSHWETNPGMPHPNQK